MKPKLLILTVAAVFMLATSLVATPSVAHVSETQEVTSLSHVFADTDLDGLTDSDEISIGSDPSNVDSDCDYLDDSSEVGDPLSPADTDGDHVIDALENNKSDSDHDDTKDHQDASTNIQAICGRFKPFAIANDGSDSSRLEVRVTGGINVSGVTVVAPTFSMPDSLDWMARPSLRALPQCTMMARMATSEQGMASGRARASPACTPHFGGDETLTLPILS